MSGVDVFVDVGKSGMRLDVVTRAGVSSLSGMGVSPVEGGDHGDLVGREIARLLAGTEPASIETIVVGTTTELTDAETQSLVGAVQAHGHRAVIAVTDDGTLAHARLLNAPGTLLSVGTGVIAIARARDASVFRFDGWGPLAGDRGSATSVGIDALRHAFCAVDERRRSEIRNLVERTLGPLDVILGRTILADPQWPAHLAELAQDVCGLAEAGDAEAGRLLDLAAAELARTARLGLRASGAAAVVVTGRFGSAHAMRSRLQEHLSSSEVVWTEAHAADVVSAAEILAGPYATSMLIVRGGQ